MEKYTFIDRYFHSQSELLDIRHTEDRDINTLFTYLNNLHSTADKLLELFDCNIKTAPEFKMLRIIRNYFHHVGDVDEIRLHVKVEENVLVIWLAARRLNQGKFHWPGIHRGMEVELDPEQLQALVLGLPWQRVGAGGAITLL